MSRLLWISDAGVPSGFGNVTKEIAGRLVTEYGWDVWVMAANWRGIIWL